MKFIFATLMLFALAGCGGGASTQPEPVEALYSIHGVVLDGYREPIAGANVSVGGRVAVSDPSGVFEFAELAIGDHTVTVSKTGYLGLFSQAVALRDADVSIECTLRKVWSMNLGLADAYVRRYYNSLYGTSYNNQNFGSAAFLSCGMSGSGGSYVTQDLYYTYLGFDFDMIPSGSELQHAQLILTRSSSTRAYVLDLRQVLGPWSEYEITFDQRPGAQETALLPVGVSLAVDQSAMSLDLTAYVLSVISGEQFRYGVMLAEHSAFSGVCSFGSRESQSVARPVLVVEFVF